jgi:hypothetical protein
MIETASITNRQDLIHGTSILVGGVFVVLVSSIYLLIWNRFGKPEIKERFPAWHVTMWHGVQIVGLTAMLIGAAFILDSVL